MWQQRSRIQWLKNGDQNTHFFHGSTTQRKRYNFIKGLRDEQRVIDEMREELGKPYTSEEVGEAIRQMAPLKALGPDDMPPLFYQSYWTDVGMDVTQAA